MKRVSRTNRDVKKKDLRLSEASEVEYCMYSSSSLIN